jgi:general secretion pathway protein G
VLTAQKQKTAPATAEGFTLIEMLVVIAIIGVLAALLLPAISKVQKQAKRVKATAEVAQIAAAWNQYYSEYQHWPEVVEDEEPMKMVGELAAVLYSGAYDAEDNPRRMRFMDFKNYSSETNPITPWAEPGVLGSDPDDEEYFYWVMFDTDYNNVISGSAATPEIDDPLTNDVRRAVIVWAANMDVAEESSSYDPEEYRELYIIGSWE